MNAEFVHYLDSVISLDALDRITKDLDEELKDSQNVMNDIKNMMDSLPRWCQEQTSATDNGQHENISGILSQSPPNLLPPDITDCIESVDIDIVLAGIKSYADDMKKNLPTVEVQSLKDVKMEDLNLEQYAVSLDMLCKRLNNLKLNKKVESERNMELEAKLATLSDDVNMFTKMVQAKTKLSEVNQNWTPLQHSADTFSYNDLINKMLASINEVTYLLQNKQ